MQHALTAGTGDQTCCCTTTFNVQATTEGDLRYPTAALVGSEGGTFGLLWMDPPMNGLLVIGREKT